MVLMFLGNVMFYSIDKIGLGFYFRVYLIY